MKRREVVTLLFLCGWLAAGCATQDRPKPPPPPKPVPSSMEARLYAHGGESPNLLFSPQNLRHLGAVLQEGARGATQGALEGFFGASYKPVPQSGFKDAAGAFVQSGYGVLAEYKLTLLERYKASIANVDFKKDPKGAAQTINGWIDARTDHLIPSLIQPTSITPDTRLFLATTAFFEAPWRIPFSSALNVQAPFYGMRKTSQKITYMRQVAPLEYGEQEGVQVAALPYEGNRMRLILALPTSKEQMGAAEGAIFGALPPMSAKNVELHLPKLEIKMEYPLKESLARAGVGVVFSNEADFSGITGDKSLYVSEALHACAIVMDETRTRAAAASGAALATKSLPRLPASEVTMRLDRPFLFAIVETQSNTPLFMGRIGEL